MIFDLPTALAVEGRSWEIDADYRNVLRILAAFEDPDLSEGEKAYVCLYNLYRDFAHMPAELAQAAFDAAVAFIDHGSGGDGAGPRTMDWAQDAPLIFPAVNRVAGMEVRSVAFMHWWTFLGLFMEIGRSTCATVLGLRAKRARGCRLEKHEQEYWDRNRAICQLRRRLSADERAAEARLQRALG